MPDCRMPPPNRLRTLHPSRRRSRGPARHEPTGHPSPLLKLTITVAASRPSVSSETPSAAAAFQRRAPSRCSGSRCSSATARIARSASSGITAPPAALCVFSTLTPLVRGRWGDAGRIASRTSSGVRRPPGAATGRLWQHWSEARGADWFYLYAVPTAGGAVTFHDPCYLGRHNGIFDQPRALIEQTGAKLIEPARTRSNSFCCGAGGGQFWKEEEKGNERVSTNRYRELKQSGAKAVATGCPFCMRMMTEEAAKEEPETAMEVLDVAEMVARNLAK